MVLYNKKKTLELSERRQIWSNFTRDIPTFLRAGLYLEFAYFNALKNYKRSNNFVKELIIFKIKKIIS